MTARVPLHVPHNGAPVFAVVDEADLSLVGGFKWRLTDLRGGTHYACRFEYVGGGRSTPVYLHRQLLGLEAGDPRTVDHINGDGLDNRRANLRICTQAENHQNRRPRQYGTSRFRGVYFNKRRQKWMARATVDYKLHYIGLYDSEVEAAKAAEAWRREHMPFAHPDPELALVTSADERTARVEAEPEQQPRTTGPFLPVPHHREERESQEASRVLRSGDDFDPPEAA